MQAKVLLFFLVAMLLQLPSAAAQVQPQPKIPLENPPGDLQQQFEDIEWKVEVVKMQHSHLTLSARNLISAVAENKPAKALCWAVDQLGMYLGLFDLSAMSVFNQGEDFRANLRDEQLRMSLPGRMELSNKTRNLLRQVQAMYDDLPPGTEVSLNQAKAIMEKSLPKKQMPKIPQIAQRPRKVS